MALWSKALLVLVLLHWIPLPFISASSICWPPPSFTTAVHPANIMVGPLPVVSTSTICSTTTRRRSPRLAAAVRKDVSDEDDPTEVYCDSASTSSRRKRATISKPARRTRRAVTTPSSRKTEEAASYNSDPQVFGLPCPNICSTSSLSEEVVVASDDASPRRKNHKTLPRTLEMALRLSSSNGVQHVLGIDEAGRGPLAGPVVVAAVCMDLQAPRIPGIVDSKRITSERAREALYEQLVTGSTASEYSSCRWSVAVIDAAKIDEINILQATLLGMRLVAETIVRQATTRNTDGIDMLEKYPIHKEASISHSGCYVVHSGGCPPRDVSVKDITQTDFNDSMESSSEIAHTDQETDDDPSKTSSSISNKSSGSSSTCCTDSAYYALIDGNRIPERMPCPAQAVVKGDGREYCIAAASIIAKVTRDRLMHAYDELYPAYGLAIHKGYPTAVHLRALIEHGGAPIHRRTFAPLKHMLKVESQ